MSESISAARRLLREFNRSETSHAETLPCGQCAADVGEACVTPSGHLLPISTGCGGFHKARVTGVTIKARRAAPSLVTIAEVADHYNVSRSTIYRRVKDGTLTAYKLGSRTIRFDAAEVANAFRAAA